MDLSDPLSPPVSIVNHSQEVFQVISFLDYSWEIVNISTYLTKYSKIMAWMIKYKIFCVKIFYKTKSSKIVQVRYRKKFNISTNRSHIFL